MIRDIRNLFEVDEKDYYKPVRVNNFLSNNYIEYKSNGDKNKTLSVKKYVNKIIPYLTLSQLDFFMYVKQLGWGKITPPE